MRNVVLLGCLFLLVSFSDISLKKRISDTHFRYEFYTSDEAVKAKPGRTYYWFKGGAIHTSENGISGEPIHDLFEKFYLTNQLAEKGYFKYGLKNGKWQTWYENGVLSSETDWSNGQEDGKFRKFSESGQLLEYGKYNSGKKDGKWINAATGDTLNYKNGVAFKIRTKAEKQLDRDTAKAKKEAAKKDKELKKEKEAKSKPNQKGQAKPKPEKLRKISKDTTNQEKAPEKPSFFKRLFAKKETVETK